MALARAVGILLSSGGFDALQSVLVAVGPFSVTTIFRGLRSRGVPVLFHVLPGRLTTRAFIRVSSRARRFLVRNFDSDRLGRIISRLFISSTISLVRRVPTGIMGHVLERTSGSVEGRVGRLLGCPRSDTNSVVAARFVILHPSVATRVTVGEVEEANISGRAVCAYCMASTGGGLVNVAAMGSLLLTRSSRLMGSVVRRGIVSMAALTSRRRITRVFSGCGFLTLPIISGRGQLINVMAVSSTVSIVRRRTARSVRGVTTMLPSSGPCVGADIFNLCGGETP